LEILKAERPDAELKGIDEGLISFEPMMDGLRAAVLPRTHQKTLRRSLLDPALKGWLDNVLVPAMVLRCLAQRSVGADNGVVSIPERVQ